MVAGHIGLIVTAGRKQGGEAAVMDAGVPWCADNGAFGKNYPGDAEYLAWLAALPSKETCLFAVAPDVICDHQRTVRRSSRFMATIRSLGYRVAFVAQNGATPRNVPWVEFDVLFVGGDTEWKLGPAARLVIAEAKRLGKWVHMGRVNSGRRMRYAREVGCDSADGTYLTFGPDLNLPAVLDWADEARDQYLLQMWDDGPAVAASLRPACPAPAGTREAVAQALNRPTREVRNG